MTEPTYLGNQSLLQLPKTAFLCSRTITPSAVLKCYDWAMEMRTQGRCVISGFHSPLEQDVLHFLLKGKQPIVMVLGRSMYRQLPEELHAAINENRLLIISPVSQTTHRHSLRSADIRNRYIAEQAERIVFACLHEKSHLFSIYQEAMNAGKAIEIIG
jgi:predicted Rossmann fold nucleotide-binding protein DprA/Smf involved in DNA uptake